MVLRDRMIESKIAATSDELNGMRSLGMVEFAYGERAAGERFVAKESRHEIAVLFVRLCRLSARGK